MIFMKWKTLPKKENAVYCNRTQLILTWVMEDISLESLWKMTNIDLK